MNAQAKVLMIGGPTAVGKTALAVHLAQQFGTVVINADAFQVYRGMDIGTAKPTAAEQAAAPHRLIDILEPDAPFSVAEFMTLATREIANAHGQGRLPLLVGGTGFYLNALRLGLPLGVQGQTPARAHWQQFFEQHGVEALHAELAQRDPAAAAAIPAGNSRRVIRALEVIENTGGLFSQQAAPQPQFNCLIIGLTTERELLYQRINARVDAMMAAGLLQEVQTIYARVGPDAQALAAIGYKEFIPYLQGDESLTTAVELVKRNSRRYAKRQLTYFHNQMPAHWFDLVQAPASVAEIDQLVQSFIQQ
jgi:tRNA dimethylallyltransferase